jgi:hypothetical protein
MAKFAITITISFISQTTFIGTPHRWIRIGVFCDCFNNCSIIVRNALAIRYCMKELRAHGGGGGGGW